MEEVLYKTLPESIQDETKSRSHEVEDVLESTLSSTPKVENKGMGLNAKQETKQEMNGHFDNNSESFGDESKHESGPEQRKVYSPTLIESAFKVMKNLFSPDKAKSKSSISSIQQHVCSSGSPSNNICITSKVESAGLDTGIENPSITQTGENSTKNQLNTNQVGVLFSPLPLESHNNTDESFLTTVSIIDESFHSAITNLDENGETTKFETNVLENFLNNTQNSELGDLYNDTLENTTLRNGSFNSEGTKVENLSTLSRDGSGEYWSSSQFYSCSKRSLGNLKLSVVEVQSEAVKEELFNGMTLTSDNSATAELLSEENLKGDHMKSVSLEEDLSRTFVQLGTPLERKTENLLLNRPNEPYTSASPPNQQTVVHESQSDTINVERKIPELDFLHQVERKESEFCFENADVKQDVSLVNTISTTTIVLNSGDSADAENMFDSLKEDASEANTPSLTSSIYTTSTSSENMVDYESFKEVNHFEPIESNLGKSNVNERNSFTLHVPQKNKSSVSELDSSASNVNKIKLHKSYELLNRRMSNESFEGKKVVHKKKSSFDVSLIKNTEASKKSASDITLEHTRNFGSPTELNVQLKEAFQDMNKLDKEFELKQSAGVPIICQQSYTILTTSDKDLNRPVIEVVNADKDFPERETFQTPDTNKTLSEKTMVIEGGNYCNTSLSGTDLANTSEQKHSTPLRKENVLLLPKGSSQTVAQPISLDHSTPKESNCQEKTETKNPSVSSKAEALGDKTQKLNSNEYPADFSPVNPINENELIFSNSVESETEGSQLFSASGLDSTRVLSASDSVQPNRTSDVKGVSKKPKEATTKAPETVLNLNKTFDKNPTAQDSIKSNTSSKNDIACEKLNATFDKNSSSSPTDKSNKTFTKEKESSESKGTNQTFIVSESPECNEINKTFNKSSVGKGSETNVAPSGVEKLNETFDEKPQPPLPSRIDQSTDGKSGSPAPNKSNQTFVKEKKPNGSHQKNAQEMNKTFEVNVNMKVEDALGAEGRGALGKQTKTAERPNGDVPVEQSIDQQASDYLDGCHRDVNGSSVSPRSSNTSLVGCELSTFLLNDEFLSRNLSMEELAGKMGKLNLNDSSEKNPVANGPSVASASMLTPLEEQIAFPESVSPLDDRLKCDPYLVQLIQEQFSSNEIEKICSVVDDLSTLKLSNQILKASEQFDKSFHENVSNAELKPAGTEPEPEAKTEKFANPLSPKSFDFLSSIQGKPTGRDWSRESLYVKFDPLVQPNPNSLIDFFKEGEALSAEENSPAVAHNSSVCEQLLAISPQKKPDDIVPPLTPLSHRSKANKNEDKLERIKELQNEIYFLKNLYSERERTNKAKMEDYESQVAKLTGDSCFLEGKLKESNEREKALVKKMKEQTQSLEQLKVIMEEYMKVISKLSDELESLKSENQKQIEALSAEKDSYMTHLQNTEAAFTDVHAKYEKSKKTIVSLKSNETMFKNTIAEQAQKMEDFKAKAMGAQERAFKELQKFQEELSESKATHSQEAARLRAQLRKTELKVEALQESLEQKIKENQQLTAICDELIEGKK